MGGAGRGGSLSDASTVTDADGIAKVFWTTGSSAGVVKEVDASIVDDPGLPATFRTTTVEALPPYSMRHGMVAGTIDEGAHSFIWPLSAGVTATHIDGTPVEGHTRVFRG